MSLYAELATHAAATECYRDDDGALWHVFVGDRCQCQKWHAEEYHQYSARRWNNRAVPLWQILRYVNAPGRTEIVHVPASVDPDKVLIAGIASIQNAGPEHMTWTGAWSLAEIVAGLVVAPTPGFRNGCSAFIYSENPKLLFAQLANEFFPEPVVTGIHPSAVLRDVTLGKDVTIGPGTCIKHATLGDNVRIGANCTIGQRGFGYVHDGERWIPFPQVGRVLIENDVEIANNVCIDRGALGDTVIRRGAKIDNLVHIAHNAVIGEDALVIAGSVVCGSVEIGPGARIAPQSVVREHRTVGAGAVVGLGAVVVRDVDAGATVMGNPARSR